MDWKVVNSRWSCLEAEGGVVGWKVGEEVGSHDLVSL